MGNLRPKRQIVLLTLFTFLFSVVFPLGFAGNNVTHAASVLPDYYSGNDPEIGGFEEFKIDSGDLYDGVHGDGTLNVSVTFAVYNGEELSVDWSSNRPVYHVFVKGGPGGNLYSYGQGATEDWGLTAPINDNNDQVYAISHVTFYYTEEIEEVIEPLQLTSVCSDQRGKARFRIYNPNSFDLDFSYENVDNDNVGGTGTALAEDYTFFYVDAADNTANTTKLYWEGGSTVKASSNQYCKYEVTVIKEWQNSSN
ncbi:MAG: hypothetical protein JL56_00700 [Desulfotomaculum sp. BICA1-6]|nr:MAG: hypothetical protein JL56_00700 [Desulfotomaculum sp. BICA1-6]